jgi:hypothetical protein
MGSRNRTRVKFFFFHVAAMMLNLYYTKYYYTKVLYFPKIYNHTSLNVPTASSTSVNSTSQVCPSAMLVLPTVEDGKYDFRVVPNGITSFPNFTQIHHAAPDSNHADKQSAVTSLTCIHFMHIMQIMHETRTHAHAHARTHARKRARTHTRARAHTHTHTHARTHAHAHTHTHTECVSTTELHIFKMIQKTNAAYLKLHICTSR